MGLKEPTCFSSRVQIFLKTAKINKLCLIFYLDLHYMSIFMLLESFFFLLQHLREYCLNFIMLVDDNKDL